MPRLLWPIVMEMGYFEQFTGDEAESLTLPADWRDTLQCLEKEAEVHHLEWCETWRNLASELWGVE